MRNFHSARFGIAPRELPTGRSYTVAKVSFCAYCKSGELRPCRPRSCHRSDGFFPLPQAAKERKKSRSRAGAQSQTVNTEKNSKMFLTVKKQKWYYDNAKGNHLHITYVMRNYSFF